jgi:2-polyprenyl-3-methyl-5-hydroxy-6-metoxy-1,4-benzoquinol methylase
LSRPSIPPGVYRQRWNIETTAGLLEENAWAPSSFDKVVSFNCIEHIADPTAHVAVVHRVLRPGGRFLVGKRALRRIINARQFKWLAIVTAHFMLAGSLRALYQKPADDA